MCIRLLVLAGCFSFAGVATCQDASNPQPRKWSSKDGKFSVEATAVARAGDHVQLKRVDNGKIVRVPIDRLSAEDQTYLESVRKAKMAPRAEPAPATKPPANKPVQNADALDPTKLPAADQVGIELVDDTTTHLIPFGVIEVPAEDMNWRVVSRAPPVFAAESAPTNEAIVLTVAPPAPQQPTRKVLFTASYNTLVEQLTGAGLANIRGSQIDLEKDLEAITGFYMAADLPDGNSRHFITELRFEEDFTYIFQATSGSQQMTQLLVTRSRTFKPDADEPKSEIPAEIVTAVKARVAEFKALLEAGDMERVMQELMPPDVFKELQAEPEQWTSIVSKFQSRGADELKGALDRIDWERAKYSAEEETVSFSIAPRTMVFKKVDEVWRIVN